MAGGELAGAMSHPMGQLRRYVCTIEASRQRQHIAVRVQEDEWSTGTCRHCSNRKIGIGDIAISPQMDGLGRPKTEIDGQQSQA